MIKEQLRGVVFYHQKRDFTVGEYIEIKRTERTLLDIIRDLEYEEKQQHLLEEAINEFYKER